LVPIRKLYSNEAERVLTLTPTLPGAGVSELAVEPSNSTDKLIGSQKAILPRPPTTPLNPVSSSNDW
jgi:hypothetical protein